MIKLRNVSESKNFNISAAIPNIHVFPVFENIYYLLSQSIVYYIILKQQTNYLVEFIP